MRNETISHIRPIVRRSADDRVVAWVFRLTLEEAGIEAFNDIIVPAAREIAFKAWTRTALNAAIRAGIDEQSQQTQPPSKVVSLHRTLDARVAVIERQDLDVETLPL